MNIGYAYMGIAGVFIISGTLMGLNGVDPYGDILLVISLPIIYYGSMNMADDPKEGETAAAEVEADTE